MLGIRREDCTLKLPIGATIASKNDVIHHEDRYLPCADDDSFVRSFMELILRENNSCVLGGSCAGLLQCRKHDSDWPRQPQDIDVYTIYPEGVDLCKLEGEAIGRSKVTKAECKEFSPVLNKERCCTWWLHLDIDGHRKKLEVDIKETHEDILNRFEEVNNVPCMAMKDLSRYLVHYGAKDERDYRCLDLQAFENVGIDLSSDNSPVFLKAHLMRRFSSCSFDGFE